jgi:hypothetical protein
MRAADPTTSENVMRALSLGIAVLWLATLTPAALAQDTTAADPYAWKFTNALGLNLTQSSFSSNWAGGDKGSIVWVINSDATGERQFGARFNLKNQLQLAYGQTAQQAADPANPDRLVWDTPDKTTDLVAFESIGRFTLDTFVDPYLGLRLDTQFSDQSSPIGDIPFNPVKLKESAGVARVLEKTEDREAITRLGFALRQTFAQSFTDPLTREKARFTSNDGGVEWNTSVTRPVLEKRVLYKGQLLVFQPLFYSKSDALETYDVLAAGTGEPVADFWKATDVNFQNLFTAQITKHLAVNLLAHWVYDKFDAAANVDTTLPLAVLKPEIDKNVRKRGQFKETLSLALTWQMF